mmetsp:Transcript_18338/g.46315  ORF Transcript_18338/g.46315 Transcript_18338/m.46315 type:complete len:350 (-) Transcript_18338:1365-2414(-)
MNEARYSTGERRGVVTARNPPQHSPDDSMASVSWDVMSALRGEGYRYVGLADVKFESEDGHDTSATDSGSSSSGISGSSGSSSDEQQGAYGKAPRAATKSAGQAKAGSAAKGAINRKLLQGSGSSDTTAPAAPNVLLRVELPAGHLYVKDAPESIFGAPPMGAPFNPAATLINATGLNGTTEGSNNGTRRELSVIGRDDRYEVGWRAPWRTFPRLTTTTSTGCVAQPLLVQAWQSPTLTACGTMAGTDMPSMWPQAGAGTTVSHMAGLASAHSSPGLHTATTGTLTGTLLSCTWTGLGESTGYLGWRWDCSTATQTLTTYGYPGDKPWGTMWATSCSASVGCADRKFPH